MFVLTQIGLSILRADRWRIPACSGRSRLMSEWTFGAKKVFRKQPCKYRACWNTCIKRILWCFWKESLNFGAESELLNLLAGFLKLLRLAKLTGLDQDRCSLLSQNSALFKTLLCRPLGNLHKWTQLKIHKNDRGLKNELPRIRSFLSRQICQSRFQWGAAFCSWTFPVNQMMYVGSSVFLKPFFQFRPLKDYSVQDLSGPSGFLSRGRSLELGKILRFGCWSEKRQDLVWGHLRCRGTILMFWEVDFQHWKGWCRSDRLEWGFGMITLMDGI
jgi:hypothetical protein